MLVVGSGPAGATIAFLLSRAGFDVFLVDKAVFPRSKPCGGLLTYKTLKLVERIFGFGLSELVISGVVERSTVRFQVFFKGYPLGLFHSECPFFFVDRSRYDDFFRLRAIDVGARFLGAALRRVDNNRHMASTTLGCIKYGVLVGADGIGSIVRKQVFGEKPYKYGVCLECKGKSFSVPALFLGDVPRGYSWAFPNGSVGSIAMNRGGNVVSAFNRLSGLCFSRPKGWSVSFGSTVKRHAVDSVFLVGDAGFFSDGLVAEGIYYAHRTAELAAMAIADSREPESVYERYLRKEVYPRIRLLKGISMFVYEFQLFFPLSVKVKLLGNFSDILTRIVGCV